MAQHVARMGTKLVRVVGIINLTNMEINEMIRLLEEYKARGITKVFVSEVFFTGMNNPKMDWEPIDERDAYPCLSEEDGAVIVKPN